MWWRDDDATAASSRLDRLLSIADGVPVALAVIPAGADDGLAARLADAWRMPGPTVAILQHGWGHFNHAADRRKNEFPGERPAAAAAADLAAGRARLEALFGGRALAVLAPPWNRFDGRFLPLLAACGIGGISRIKPRNAARPVPEVLEVNVHVDLVDWSGERGFIGEAAALGGLVLHLRQRRLGVCDSEEPTGILTHHLVQDAATDAFLGRLVAATRPHPAARWLEAGEVFECRERGSA